jgi:hypothetical protein
LADEHQLSVIDAATLCEHGLLNKGEQFKVLGDGGKMNRSVEVIANRFSKSAKEAIAAAGGKSYTVVKLNQVQGIAHHRSFKTVTLKAMYEGLSYLNEGDLVYVAPEGELSVKFDMVAHKVAPEVQTQMDAMGGKISIAE